jgi:hypothetical protein
MVLALVGAGCFVSNPTAHVTGGGFIVSDFDVDETANFGFNVKCEGDDGAKGHLTYHDGDLKIKGTVDDCEYHDGLKVMGDWVPQGKTEAVGGRFVITGFDGGEPGIDDDFLTISLMVGPSEVYYNEGFLKGGNIQEHETD